MQDFYDYSYFTARFMTQVMQTLYYEQDRFPNVIENLLLAQPGQYFKGGITDVQIAQKYGNFQDSMGRQFTHDTGIIYTENPFILTIMTKNMGQADTVIAEFCHDFEDYARSLDEQLPAYEQAQQAAEEEARRLAEEEEQRRLAEEAEQQRLAEEAAATENAAAEQPAEPETEPAAAPVQEQEAPAIAAPTGPRGVNRGVMIGFGIVIVLLLAAFLVEYHSDRRERRYAAAARRRGRR